MTINVYCNIMLIKRIIRKLTKYGHSNGITVRNNNSCQFKLNIFGYFDYIFSISANARDFVAIAKLASSANLVPLRLVGKSICEDNQLKNSYSYPSEMTNVNLWFVNFDFINDCHRRHRKWFNGRYNIAVFWWEFEDYFTNSRCFEFLNEILVFSSVTYSALKKVIPDSVKLTKLEYPFIIKQPSLSRNQVFEYYNLDVQYMYVLYSFDVHSYLERKNPQGVLSAFDIAWQNNPKLKLVLKVTNFELWRNECQELLSIIDAMESKDSIRIISDSLTDTQMRDLIAACDIYISLHRAEGLGLGMLEAMSLGKPVIATRFGGNLDFMNDDNSLLVDYKLVAIEKPFASYKKGYLWADPDTAMAAKLLLDVSTNNELYDTIGNQAKLDILNQYNFENLKEVYNSFIQERELLVQHGRKL